MIVRDAVELAPRFVAVTTYVADAVTVVAVPLMTPVEVLRVNPAGNAGDTDQLEIGPPVLVGVSGVIATFVVAVNVVGEYEIAGANTTAIVTVSVSVPCAFVAVISYVAAAETAVGVPLITPVEAFSTNPVGRAGVTVHEDAVPPVLTGVRELIATPITVLTDKDE